MLLLVVNHSVNIQCLKWEEVRDNNVVLFSGNLKTATEKCFSLTLSILFSCEGRWTGCCDVCPGFIEDWGIYLAISCRRLKNATLPNSWSLPRGSIQWQVGTRYKDPKPSSQLRTTLKSCSNLRAPWILVKKVSQPNFSLCSILLNFLTSRLLLLS